MLPVDTFTLLTGLASLFGFAIQAFDLFPRFGRMRQTVFVLLLGVFIGSAVRAIEPSSIRINIEITGFKIFVGAFMLLLIGFLVAAALTDEPRKRGEFFGVAGVGFIGFIFTVFLGSLMFGDISTPATEKARLTISELNKLSEEAAKARDFERAIDHQKSIEARLPATDERRKVIAEKIRALQIESVK